MRVNPRTYTGVTLEVYVSEDGSTWTRIARVYSYTAAIVSLEKSFAEKFRYIRLVYNLGACDKNYPPIWYFNEVFVGEVSSVVL